MKNVNFRSKISFILVPLMVFYVFIPCISQAAPVGYVSSSGNKRATINIQPTATLTYFYNGGTLMNAEDDNGNMSTYLGRTVRSIVNVNSQTLLDTQCLFTDGKNVISQTDSTGTTVTSTQQYNAFGQSLNHNPNTNSQLSIATNPFAYDGYYDDPESGLYYLNARYYSPTLMQFISMDSYDLANRYAYCDGNPIGNEDPTGHLSTDEDIGITFATLTTIFAMTQPIAALSAYSYLASTFAKGKLSTGLAVTSYVLAGLQGLGDIYLGFKILKNTPLQNVNSSIVDLQNEKLNVNDIKKGEHLGGGVYGEVYKVEINRNSRAYKIFNSDQISEELKWMNKLKNINQEEFNYAERDAKVWNDSMRKIGLKEYATAFSYTIKGQEQFNDDTQILSMPFIDGNDIDVNNVNQLNEANNFFNAKLCRHMVDIKSPGNVKIITKNDQLIYVPVDVDQLCEIKIKKEMLRSLISDINGTKKDFDYVQN